MKRAIENLGPPVGRALRWPRGIACLLAVFGGCRSGPTFRGTDHDAVLPTARLHAALRGREPPRRPGRVVYEPGIELGTSYARGDFAQGGSRPEYEVLTGHVAFAPELSWRGAVAMPFGGVQLASLEVTDGTDRVFANRAGALFGVELAWRGWPWLQPYARLSRALRTDWVVDRFEAGVEFRVNEVFGVQVGYGRQTQRIDEDGLVGSNSDTLVHSDGLHLGFALRL